MALSTAIQDREFTKFEEVNSLTTVRVKDTSNSAPNGAVATTTKNLSATFIKAVGSVGVTNLANRHTIILEPSAASCRFSFNSGGVPAYRFPAANQPFILTLGPLIDLYIGSSTGTPTMLVTEVAYV